MKITSLSIAAISLLFSGLASAVQLPGTTTVFQTQCGNLNEDVRINLTTGVVGGVNCTTARVAFSACHTAGMLKSRSVGQKTVQVPDPTPGAAPGATVAQVQSCTVGAADPACATVAVSGAAYPSATTLLGTVNNQYPGNGDCTAARAEGVASNL